MNDTGKAKLRTLALSILQSQSRLTRKSGSFCGQLVAEPGELSDKQFDWLRTLSERAGLSHQFEDIFS